MFTMSLEKKRCFSLLMVFTIFLELLIAVVTPARVNASVQEDKEIELVANELEAMFSNGVTENNLKNYVNENYDSRDISTAEKELNTSLKKTNYNYLLRSKFSWNKFGNCMVNEIKDEFFAMINVATIVKYAKKKSWKKLAGVVLKFAKANGLKTNVAIIAGQLAVWAIKCGIG
ncbi:hypothetical protein J2Z60_002018 [Lactobacillus colini]|uniref:Streptococcin A-M57 n=1 Tax=Lactobacillus colini TaxID=1819254 RepID=A0ABS4MGK8_9LACO|nr:streptococcin A-M57 [Lactobacillus colini]MBP2058827.1 hypothetical protein [Lactobacillus colini]